MADMRRRSAEPPPGPPHVQLTPGLANGMLHELAPLLAEDGIDVDAIDVPDLDTLHRALTRAVERRNRHLFSPVGAARDVALGTLRRVVEAILDGDTALAGTLLDQVRPESPDNSVATVASCIGIALGLLDDWFSGHVRDAPTRLGQHTCLPAGHWTGERQRRRRCLTRPDERAVPAPDLIGRDFAAGAGSGGPGPRTRSASRPGARMVGDITCLATGEGWLYLADVLDLGTRALLGYAMADHLRAELVVDALRMAAATVPLRDDAIFHSDRPEQYGEIVMIPPAEAEGTYYRQASAVETAGPQRTESLQPSAVQPRPLWVS